MLCPPGAFQRLHELPRGSRGVSPEPPTKNNHRMLLSKTVVLGGRETEGLRQNMNTLCVRESVLKKSSFASPTRCSVVRSSSRLWCLPCSASLTYVAPLDCYSRRAKGAFTPSYRLSRPRSQNNLQAHAGNSPRHVSQVSLCSGICEEPVVSKGPDV